MQRYRYKKSYRKVYPRKRWASNIITKNSAVSLLANSNDAVAVENICEIRNQGIHHPHFLKV